MNIACSIPLLESALAGSLPANDEDMLQRHLETCEACSAALERMAGGTAWCQEAAALLAGDELDGNVPTRDEWSAVDFTVEHLEPSEEPNVLGRLSRYDVLEIIGHSGMSVVLKGFHRELKRPVAIKVLAPHLAHSSLARKRFLREAQAAAAVVHPHVIAVHEVGDNGRLPYLVMPLVVGESLAERLAAQGLLELKEILRIGMQAAAGLAAAHEQGLVHRDVKPANILLEKGVERAVLTDFGLARAADDVALTRWGIIAGTPEYMSPEQARGEPLDGRSDLFSLGCVLYEMATGVSPFRTDSVMATMRRLVDESPRAMASLNPELPPWFIGIVDRLLEKDPSRRFGSAKEVSELLEGCLAHVQQPANVALPAGLPNPAFRRDWRSFTIRVIGVLAMIAAAGIGLLGLVLLSADPPDIAGNWSGEGWGHVVLKRTSDTAYTGTYTDTFGKQPGEIQLKWSRLERRYNGTWCEGEDRQGKISVRLAENEIRGAWTTNKKSGINPGTPKLADLLWVRQSETITTTVSQPPAKSEPKLTNAVPKRVLHFQTNERVETIACSPDGKLIAIANGNPTRILQTTGTSRVKDNWQPFAQILDAEAGQITASLQLTTAEEDVVLAATERISHIEATAFAFSPDGKVVAVGTSIGQVKLFNLRTGELVRSLDDEPARLADEETPENWKSLKRAMGSVRSLAFSPDGGLLAMCGTSFGDFSDVFDGIHSLGRFGTGPGRLKVWDVNSGTLKHDLVGHSHANSVAFVFDGSALVSAGRWDDGSHHGNGVITWNPQTGEKTRAILIEANGGTHMVASSPTRKMVAIGSRHFDKENDTSTTTISVAYPLSGIMDWQRTIPGWANPKAFSPDGKSVAVQCGGESIQFFDTDTGQMKYEIRAADALQALRWSDFAITPHGNKLFIVGVDAEKRGAITVWDLDGTP